eukprot:CAMPEP_0196596182 /NCGR_PEP_ID=MMETSP1081-20130531/84635_1 /TAXON_ID=36882 /ORGANISM="Pyramimonas amylifera, Strain CCMP720" /LENGTH=1408 /DNA_ID=CAMNT_0041921059 /DNA_START=152 /DNA_END=4378 /DNA_ORIENTATION=+
MLVNLRSLNVPSSSKAIVRNAKNCKYCTRDASFRAARNLGASAQGPLKKTSQFTPSNSRLSLVGSSGVIGRVPLRVTAALAEDASSVSTTVPAGVAQWYRTPALGPTAVETLLKKVQAVLPEVTGIQTEQCFNVQLDQELSTDQKATLEWLVRETYEPELLTTSTQLGASAQVVEVGPRMNFSTALSANAVSICNACGLSQVSRLERSRRFSLLSASPLSPAQLSTFASLVHDRMTECVYEKPLETFKSDRVPEDVCTIPILAEGRTVLERMNEEMGLAFDDWDLDYYTALFRDDMKRDPTNVELFDIAQSNSEHSRHWFFKANLTLDGEPLPQNLFEIVGETLKAQPDNNSVIAFHDNSSALRGPGLVAVLWPSTPGAPGPMQMKDKDLDVLFTAETHNFPCAVAPLPGAETGAGGRMRDTHATGRGSLMTAGTAGYCVGNLNIKDSGIPLGEVEAEFPYPSNLAPPTQILIDASNGASDYGNKFGEPLIQGYCRTFGLRLPNGERREWLKPIMFSAGFGAIDHTMLDKYPGEIGMLVVKIGGPAYRIGMGGGAASSVPSGTRNVELDFNAVQRGDGEMSQKLYRVVKTCVEMGEANPIISIHDQGAGGNCNVLKELIDPLGGVINIRELKVGDATMSVLDLWGAEYQENDAMLIRPEAVNTIATICARERLPFSVVGEITGSGRVTVVDSLAPEGSLCPEDLELEKVLGSMPNKTYHFTRTQPVLVPLELPEETTVQAAMSKVLQLPSVCSKRFLTNKVDRAVTGLVAQQQCVGPLQLPLADVAVIARSHFDTTGAACSIGEQPIKGFLDAAAMARMSVAECLTNMCFARISDIKNIKASGNWMWAAKMEGEGAAMYDCALAMRDAMIEVGMAIDGGKDSLSMAATAAGEVVKTPGSLVISAYCDVPDITKTVTPDLKLGDAGRLLLVDLASGKRRTGGSALAQAYSQIGSACPDIDSLPMLRAAFVTMQGLLDDGLVSAGHDVSDGGALTTLLEMAFAGNCGVTADFPAMEGVDNFATLFAEESGLVLEVGAENVETVLGRFSAAGVPASEIGFVSAEPSVNVSVNGSEPVISGNTATLRDIWEATSFDLERLQSAESTVEQEQSGLSTRTAPKWKLTFTPTPTSPELMSTEVKPKVAIIREEGSNGDREMAAAMHTAGLEPWDVTMSDLQNGRINLEDFRGCVFVGGFSYADVLDSAKGWAGGIRYNELVKEQCEAFFSREDTFSLGICNGCQLEALLGWVPSTDGSHLPDTKQPRFVHNQSGRFESRWSMLRVEENSPSVLLKGMGGSTLGVWVAHGEGQLHFPDAAVEKEVLSNGLAPLRYVDDSGDVTESYPANPNGSPHGIAALCSANGRHLAMMPHPERCFLGWQLPYAPAELEIDPKGVAPWIKLFQNARLWCDETTN